MPSSNLKAPTLVQEESQSRVKKEMNSTEDFCWLNMKSTAFWEEEYNSAQKITKEDQDSWTLVIY